MSPPQPQGIATLVSCGVTLRTISHYCVLVKSLAFVFYLLPCCEAHQSGLFLLSRLARVWLSLVNYGLICLFLDLLAVIACRHLLHKLRLLAVVAGRD